MTNPTFLAFLKTASTTELISRRAWLDGYAGRTYNGHSEIARNLKLYDAEIALRTASNPGW